MPKKHVLESFNLNSSEIFRLSFVDIFLWTLDTYTNKMYARRTRSFSRARMRSSNSARMNKSNFTTEKIV